MEICVAEISLLGLEIVTFKCKVRRSTVRLKTHEVETRKRKPAPILESKSGTDFRNVCHAKTTPISDSGNRVLYK